MQLGNMLHCLLNGGYFVCGAELPPSSCFTPCRDDGSLVLPDAQRHKPFRVRMSCNIWPGLTFSVLCWGL